MAKTSTSLERPTPQKEPIDQSHRGFGYKSILFNCHCHTFQEVALQLVKAIHCSYQSGLQLANVVHYTGSAVVYSGVKERCESVVAILQDIGLIAKVEQ